MSPSHEPIYEERLTSGRTEAVFVALMLLGSALWAWQMRIAGWTSLAIIGLMVAVLFLFYSLNYRVLRIRLTPQRLTLRFGLIPWQVDVSTIAECELDDVPLGRIGGAGVHFSPFEGRYRAMFNFLEHPRIVVRLKERRGPVWDIAFSTAQPDEVLRLLREVMSSANEPAR